MKRFTLPALAALGLLISGLPATAQTISFGDAYARLAKSCGRDIERLCSTAQMGGNGIRACLEKNAAKVSADCKQTQAETFALLGKRIQAQTTAVQVCERDRLQYCRGVQPHDGYQLACLLKATKVVSASCKQVIVDAGWND